MKTKTRLLMFVLAITLFFSTSISVYAVSKPAEETDNIEGVVVTTEVAKTIASDWAAFIEPDLNLQVSDVIELYDYDDKICGYSVSFQQNNIPYGYVMLDFSTDNYISEYVIQENAKNICDAVLNQAGVSTSLCNDLSNNAKLYKMLPFEYSVSLENDGLDVLYDAHKGSVSNQEFQSERNLLKTSMEAKVNERSSQSTPVGHWGDIIIRSIPSGYTTIDALTQLSSTSSITESYIEDLLSKYACVVQAMTNVANQCDLLLNDSIADTYNYLWTESGTTESSEKDGIIYGTTLFDKMGSSLKALAKSLGKNSSSYSNSTSPSYTTFKNAVNAGKSSIFGAGVTVTDGDTEERVGHAVSVVGYRSAKDSSNKVYQYIYIADGWYTTLRYVCISDTQYFTDTYSTVLTFK